MQCLHNLFYPKLFIVLFIIHLLNKSKNEEVNFHYVRKYKKFRSMTRKNRRKFFRISHLA